MAAETAAETEKNLSPGIKEELGHKDPRFPRLLEGIDQLIRTILSTSTTTLPKELVARGDELNKESTAIYRSAAHPPQPSRPKAEAISVRSNLHGRYPRLTDVLRIFADY